MVTTLSPCDMCTGAILLYKIPRVVVGENRTFYGAEDLLRSRGVEVVVLDDDDCVAMMTEFIADRAVAVERGHRRRGLSPGGGGDRHTPGGGRPLRASEALVQAATPVTSRPNQAGASNASATSNESNSTSTVHNPSSDPS